MTLGEILRNLLTDRDITQKQLAENLHIGASTLGNYIQDNREPDYNTLKILANYFNVSTDFLLDHRSGIAVSHFEDELLSVFRAMSPEQQELYLQQGKLFYAHYLKNKPPQRKLRIADSKPKYKGGGKK